MLRALNPMPQAPCSMPDARPRLAYILAASHSGSTLLAMLLGAHPEACTVGELAPGGIGDPERYRCSCGELIRQCEFWKRVRQAMANQGIPDFDICQPGTVIQRVPSAYARRLLAPLPRGPVLEAVRDLALGLSRRWKLHLAETQRRTTALVRSLLSITGAKLVVDSSKHPLRLNYLLRNPALDIRVIRLIRDGRAVALTYLDEWQFADAADPALRGGGAGMRRPPARRTMAEAAREWRRSQEAAESVLARLPRSHWIEIHYETLCTKPQATVEQLCAFLGIDPGRVTLDFRSKPQHVVGNGMRLDRTAEIRLDERWKTHLTAEQLREFDRVAGPLNRRYGYV
jgi:hypothetical protein